MVQSTKDMKPNEVEKKVAKILKSIKDKKIGGRKVISTEVKGLFCISMKSRLLKTFRHLYVPSFFLSSVCQSVSQSVRQSVNRSISQSVSQSVSQSISQLISQSIFQSGCQSVNQSISQSASQSALSPTHSFVRPFNFYLNFLCHLLPFNLLQLF